VWIDGDGVAHTVALPDPTRVMSEDFHESLDALAARDRPALRLVVKRAEVRAYEADWSDLRGSEIHVRAAAPVGPLRGRVVSPDDLAHAIDRVVPRWRLDTILALDDYLDE
jgi:hypothetical protein